MFKTSSYLAYAIAGAGLTLFVARTLHRRGRVFLLDAFGGNEALADAQNDQIAIGTCLIGFGLIAVLLPIGTWPEALLDAIEHFSAKLGAILLLLGVLHSYNVRRVAAMRRRALAGKGV